MDKSWSQKFKDEEADASSNNISLETDIKVFKNNYNDLNQKMNVKNKDITISKNRKNDITNINININNSQFSPNDAKNLSKIIVPNLIELNKKLSENNNNVLNTFSSRQPVEVSFRDAINLMYKKIENENSSKFKDIPMNKKEIKNFSLIKKKEKLNLKINEFKETLKNIKPNKAKALISESPLNNIQMPISYNINDFKKDKFNKKVITTGFLNNMKKNIINKVEKNILFSLDGVISNYANQHLLFVTQSEIILQLPYLLFKDKLNDYDGDDFTLEISTNSEFNDTELTEMKLKHIHKKYCKQSVNKDFSKLISSSSNSYILNKVSSLKRKKL